MNTREQIEKLRKENPNWSKSDIARAVVPPVSPQRIGQIENNTNPYTLNNYRERIRHKYHRKVGRAFKNCKRCVLPLDKG